jgi:hypothetical protein
MSTRPDLDRSISEWLVAEVPDRAPERLLEASRERIRNTSQRRAWWPAWRSPTMNKFVTIGLAAAAVVVLAVVAYQFLGSGGVGNPPSDPSTSSEPSRLAPTPLIPGSGMLEPGEYLVADVDPFTITVTIPSGWESLAIPAQVWGPGDNRPAVGYATVDGLFANACDPSQGYLDVGPTVADFLQALRETPGLYLAQTGGVEISGYEGTRVELTGAGIDCEGSEPPLWMTTQPGSTDRPHPATFWGRSQLTILDIDGDRLVIIATLPANSEPQATNDAEAIVNSTVIEGP